MGGIFGSWQPSLRDVKRIVHVDAKLLETLISNLYCKIFFNDYSMHACLKIPGAKVDPKLAVYSPIFFKSK